jgi:hypothetical protein
VTRARLAFAGWPAAQPAPGRDQTLGRQLGLLRRVFTPRTVFMEIGSPDGELALRAAGYVERVWSIDARGPVGRAPCNLRSGGMGGVPLSSIDVAFSERVAAPHDVCRLLARGGVWFVYGRLVPAPLLRAAGFARVRYFARGLRLPAALARLSQAPATAAYK